jgi:hypothetical protein
MRAAVSRLCQLLRCLVVCTHATPLLHYHQALALHSTLVSAGQSPSPPPLHTHFSHQ